MWDQPLFQAEKVTSSGARSDDQWFKSLMLRLLSYPGIGRKSNTLRSLVSHTLLIPAKLSKVQKVVHERKVSFKIP